jgi:8-oxo-dGTP pyrophosphatase MutT (NUDIX family)
LIKIGESIVPASLEFSIGDEDKTWEKVLQFKPFADLIDRLGAEPSFTVKKIAIRAVQMFGDQIGFIMIDCEVYDRHGAKLPGAIFLRNSAVVILPVLKLDGRFEYTVVTVQARAAAAMPRMVELPSGTIDDGSRPWEVAYREFSEETGYKISHGLINLTESVLGPLEPWIWLSPGGSTETIQIFAFIRNVSLNELKSFDRRQGGLREEGEGFVTAVIPLEDLVVTRDAKSITALKLYEIAKSRGRI